MPSKPKSHIASRPSVAVIGTGISGLSAAWLLAPHVDLTVYEAASRIGGHSNTVDVDLSRNLSICALAQPFCQCRRPF